MSPDLGLPIFHTPFAAASEKKPYRTYSHKGKNRRVGLLPPLRENIQQRKRPRAHSGNTHFARGGGKPKRDIVDTGYSGEDVDAEEVEEARIEADAASDGEDGTGMEYSETEASPTRLRVSHTSDEYDELEHSDEVDDSWSTLASSLDIERHLPPARLTRFPKRSIRRRPFLMYNKPPPLPRGYKKLKTKPDADGLASPVKHRPGDGFSENEARPDSLFHLTRKRKLLPHGASAVGPLDLTQSKQSPKKKKKASPRAEQYDNSFDVSRLNKASRRDQRHPKPKHQEDISAQEPQLEAAAEERPEFPIKAAPAVASAKEDSIIPEHRKDNAEKGPAQVTREVSVEIVEVPFSEDTPKHPSIANGQPPSRTQEETTSSWETFVSETVATQQLRVESTSPLPLHSQQTVDVAVQTIQWVFRRAKSA
ncbi:hypothetical protein B0H67DRAFT_253152 [Lasiosphaeris hirsuta]|uniref:Uncharacterized protein n=1 Tax=Lasiosphaeris hirsuta TaxID=260670 RepID=A0AA40AHD0_9PEZI|nr:hypothetical protein B0H67DRAFT_253152 [Lasiosphaeris hirsuta]